MGLIGQSPAVSHAGAVQLDATLGDSAVVLSGPWKFHVGDNAAWGERDFDDSDWGTIDLTPPPGPADEDLRPSGFIPGWTSNGYPGYSGYAWYRLRINVASSHGALAIKMPMDVDDAYQVFVNGRQIGEFGKFTKGRVTAYLAEPRAFRLPLEVRSGPMTIGVRMWMDSATPFNSPCSGGMHEPPVLGRVGVIMALVGMDQKDTVLGIGSSIFEILFLLLAWTVAAMLLWMDRKEPAYLWMSLVCVAMIDREGHLCGWPLCSRMLA